MATTRSFTNPYELTDLTDEIQIIPNTWGLLENMGLFAKEGVGQNTLTLEKIENTIGLIGSSRRGTRENIVNKDDLSKMIALYIPHFNIMDRIEPQDLQGKRRIGTDAEQDSLAMARMRKLERMRKSAAITKEYLRFQSLKGNLVTPSGEVVANMYNAFDAGTQKVVDFVLGTAATKVADKIEEVIAHIQDNMLTGDVVNEMVVLTSPEFFQKLVTHAKVESAYIEYKNENQNGMIQVLRDRLGTGLYRSFYHMGLTFVEVRGSYSLNGVSTRLIEANDAYAIPVGTTDMFVEYNGPADHLDYIGTVGEELYAFEHRDPRGFYHDIYVEFNTLPVVRRPQAVVKLTSSN